MKKLLYLLYLGFIIPGVFAAEEPKLSSISSGAWIVLRSIAGEDPWLFVPEDGAVFGKSEIEARRLVITKHSGSSGAVITTGDNVFLQGTSGPHNYYLHAPSSPEKPVVLYKDQRPSVFQFHKIENTNSPGGELRAGDYVTIQDTAGQNLYLTLSKKDQPLVTASSIAKSTVFKIENVAYPEPKQSVPNAGMDLVTMAMWDCSSVELRNGWQLVGRVSKQEAYVRVLYNKDEFEKIRSTFESCVKNSAVKAAVVTLLSKGTGGWQYFLAQVSECSKNELTEKQLEKLLTLEVGTRCL